MSVSAAAARRGSAGFTLVEMIVVTLLLAIAMLGILAVFDASSRINKSESELADAQGNVRYGIYKMSSTIRMAGSGGLFVTQAVLNHADPQMNGIVIKSCSAGNIAACSYDNVSDSSKVVGLDGDHPIRPGTDMIEVRGVINSPMVGFDQTPQNGCGACNGGSVNIVAKDTVGSPLLGTHVNEDTSNRPQFEAINTYTASAATNPMFVLVAQNDDLHNGCSQPSAQNPNPQSHYPQPTYNVGKLSAATTSTSSTLTFSNVNFADATAQEFNTEFPQSAGSGPQALTGWIRHAGILDDIVYFIDDKDPNHPALAQGIRRGDSFDVISLGDDVEDMQIAYGVDTDANEAVTRLNAPTAGTDPDTNVSVVAGKDEWVPNVPGNDNPLTSSSAPFLPTDFVANSAGALSTHCARLHSVMISLLARSKSSDPTYRSPLSQGLVLMNAVTPTPGPTPLGRYRRRVQTLKINLRNYEFQG
jgi:prepilin-type N-terminal cleavage/methylation domain-containing protein